MGSTGAGSRCDLLSLYAVTCVYKHIYVCLGTYMHLVYDDNGLASVYFGSGLTVRTFAAV